MTQKQNHAIKLSPMIDIPQTFRDLPETFAVHMVAVEGECKGVVFLLSRNNFPVNDIHRSGRDLSRPQFKSKNGHNRGWHGFVKRNN